MHVKYLSVLALSWAASATVLPRADDQNALDQLAALAQEALEEAQAQSGAAIQNRASTCTWNNVKVRKEWGNLSTKERTDYINAVKCLQGKPAKTPASVAAGAKTRFDDFVATHIQQTLTIHYTGNFLGWHRYYTWLYEQALQTECGYKGTQPYWDWSKTAANGLEKSPIFDGSATSMSGNGKFIPNQEQIMLGAAQGLPPIYLPTGTGGGCVTSGPFKDMKVNLGPAALDIPGGQVVSQPNPLAYNPRCLKRDLTTAVNKMFANATAVVNNIIQPRDIDAFQMQMQGIPGSGNIGIHGGGHYSLGGDPGRDVFSSPGDPAFYLHHGMIDRVWWIWQMLDPQKRQFSDMAVAGTNTFLNSPPSAKTTLDNYVEYGYAAGPKRKLRELMSTMAGPFCYVYE